MNKLNRRSFIKLASIGTLAATIPTSAFGNTKPQELPSFSFVQLTDTHISHESGIERTKKAVEAINTLSLPYDLVVHTGDISNGHGNIEDMKKAHDILKFDHKAYFLPGNADVTFENPEKFEPTFTKIFGSCNQSFSPVKGLRFVLFNSQSLSDKADASVRERALIQLQSMLQPAMPTVLFCHATGLPDFYNNQIHSGWDKKTMEKWTHIMSKGGVFAILAGHFHRDESHMLGEIPVHTCAPVVGWWGRQTTFRHWMLQDGELTYRTIYVK